MSDAWDGLPPEEFRAVPRFHYLRENASGDEVMAEWNPSFDAADEDLLWWIADRPVKLREIAADCTYIGVVPTHAELAALRARAERAEAEVVKAIGYLTRNCLAPRKAKPHDDLMGICTQVDHLLSTARAEALREAVEIIRSRVQVRIEPHFRAAASKIEAGIAGGMAAMADDVAAAISDLIMRTVLKEKPMERDDGGPAEGA